MTTTRSAASPHAPRQPAVASATSTPSGRIPRTHVLAAASLAAFLSACANGSFQLASPYDETIDTLAQSLESDFLTFAAERQQNAGTPAGAYPNYANAYTEFSARIAVLTLRAAADPGGTTCGEALKRAQSLATDKSMSQALTQASLDTSQPQSCVSLEVAQLQKVFTMLQAADQQRCAAPLNQALCGTVFPAGSVSDLLPTTDSHKAPLVRAVVQQLDTMVGFEQDLKPASKG